MPVSPRCTFCGKVVETYVHVFWDCEFAQKILICTWSFVQNKDYYTKETALFPADAPVYIIVLYTYVKFYINKCRMLRKKLDTKWFKAFLRFHLKALQTVAYCKGKESEFHRCWRTLLDRLSYENNH